MGPGYVYLITHGASGIPISWGGMRKDRGVRCGSDGERTSGVVYSNVVR